VYYGTSANTSLTEAQIEALASSGLQSGRTGNYTFGAGDYKWICYPTSFGTTNTSTGFKDTSTNLAVPFESPLTVSVTNAYGQTTNYYAYRSTNIMGSTITIQVV
jgi:hypothetical protein